jgi:hypothetical protein
MRAFRTVGRHYVAGLGPTEREVFATVVADVAELLGAGRFEDGGEDDVAPEPAVESWTRSAVPAPADPAVRRLLPDASRDDDAVTAEFRRLTEADLRASKIDRLRSVWRALRGEGEVLTGVGIDDDEDLVLRREDADAFAAALTDVRLVLAERLGLETEEDADRLYEALEAQAAAEEAGWPDDDRPARQVLADELRAYLGSVYAALTWLQESLVSALLADLGRPAD